MLLDLCESLGYMNVAVLIVILSGFHIFIIKPLYFSSLSHVPGPKITCLTSGWILYKTWSEKRNRLVHSLHHKYGPIVRLSPNEISIADPKYIKIIYSGNFDKSSFYAQFDAYGERNAFSSCQKAEHLEKRKVLNQIYSKSFICSPPTEKMTQTRIKNTMKYIADCLSASESHQMKPSVTIEVYNLFHAMAMDTATGFILGDSNGTNLLQGSSKGWQMLEMFRQRTAMWFCVTLMPRFHWLAETQASINVTEKIADWMKGLVFPVQQTLSKDNSSLSWDPALDPIKLRGETTPHQTSPTNVVERLYIHGVKGLAALSEIEDHTVAGHETTGATLSYLTYHLSLNTDIQDKLRAELCAVQQVGKKLDYRTVDSLPYLNGVLMETLRLYGAIPGAEPRLVPKQGMQCEGYRIPAQTIVSIQPWTLHRDAAVYKEPLVFRPERWYESSQDDLRKMNKSFMAFGAGIRMCLGMHLAMQEMKLITANIYSKYRTTVSKGWDHEQDMHIVDKYTVHPQGHRCLLDFSEFFWRQAVGLTKSN
jgi:hypothetical protein